MKVVMNHTQFLEWKYGNKTTLDIKLENLGIKNKKKLEKSLVIGLAAILFFINRPHLVYADGIDDLGSKFLELLRRGGRWVCIICSTVELIRGGIKKGNGVSEVGQIIAKYSLLYAALYILTWIFDEIEKTFEGGI